MIGLPQRLRAPLVHSYEKYLPSEVGVENNHLVIELNNGETNT